MARRYGISLLEVLAVLAILVVLALLLLPAIQQTRESARRLQCESHLKQLGLAIHAYEGSHGFVPPGNTMGHSWMGSILPHLDQAELYRRIDFTRPYDQTSFAAQQVVPLFQCPSEPTPSKSKIGTARASYTGNFGTGVLEHGYNGIFQQNKTLPGQPWPSPPVRWRDVTDGLSQTAMVSEFLIGDGGKELLRVNWNLAVSYNTLAELRAACVRETPRFFANGSPVGANWSRGFCWLQGQASITWYNHAVPPFHPSCFNGSGVQDGIYSAGSAHSEGVNLLFADGHVQFIARSIDDEVWRAIGSRNGQETVSLQF